ncbi:kinase domain protein (macronuclear) [Tetrahymena thermophila SB210]|nr:kinase domain protein [Tetrahymena thermophila SB210]EAR80675.1 kinase domain protein [Tetrahymena thermophila SB210]|eukprot:XP_001028338.1 kinase domain protein [Tetrahymena thermophila SB210]
MNGYGKLYYPSGQLAYEGKWKDDKFDGRGVIYNEKPIPISYGEEIDFQDFNKMSEEWTKFDGEFKIDEKTGFGTFYFSNSSKFQCNFMNDMAEGVGTFTLSDGKTQIVGDWKQNILVNIYQQKQINH